METKLYIDRTVDLVERCKLGERKAQYDLYRQYAKAMYNVSLRILNHAAEAEDSLQEAFLDAFNHIHSFRGQSTFGAWLKQIVVNRAINHLRSRRVEFVELDTTRTGTDESAESLDWASPEPYDETEINFDVERVRKAMQQLSEGYRVVLSLYLFEGYDHEEIGQILNISETTSRTQFMRGRKRLLTVLATNEQD
ncbi:sigma-70 family RNA polymerase sigma factor [Rudanella paleaurantiibacter]|uniref:Sigma-70 family RNA polymerase sigma factor n=1 Tax=Rudanella paleaurantiibacter TaxID=2614655 RepID=A0A7J5TRP5_9BACT|nr:MULTISPECIES: sigma-70 family RNA polymerase sigma factor [Rudanella]KAB7725398.1 sigma-70 family RNA polymerase sigma factor [Rudanella paleaurantiibacter]